MSMTWSGQFVHRAATSASRRCGRTGRRSRRSGRTGCCNATRAGRSLVKHRLVVAVDVAEMPPAVLVDHLALVLERVLPLDGGARQAAGKRCGIVGTRRRDGHGPRRAVPLRRGVGRAGDRHQARGVSVTWSGRTTRRTCAFSARRPGSRGHRHTARETSRRSSASALASIALGKFCQKHGIAMPSQRSPRSSVTTGVARRPVCSLPSVRRR